MTHRNLLLTAVSVGVLALAGVAPASALDVSVGGARVSAGSGSGGGTSAGASAGGTSANASIGGGSDIGSASIGTGSNRVNARIGTSGGSLVDVNSNGATTNGSVNLGLGGAANGPLNGITGTLGSTLDGIDLPGGAAIAPGAVSGALAGLSAGEIQALKLQCSQILNNPRRFDAELVALCSILRRL
jgi:hypothetical protein